jgi:CRISPR-associated exonuclease Cas4
VVEFRSAASGAELPGLPELWQPFPIEYKRGRPKKNRCDEIQLCAQALCLEEMFSAAIPGGALYYGTPRRRQDVTFSASLRAETERLAARMHVLYSSRVTPREEYQPKCDKCSLLSRCLPKTLGGRHAVERYLSRAIGPEAAE